MTLCFDEDFYSSFFLLFLSFFFFSFFQSSTRWSCNHFSHKSTWRSLPYPGQDYLLYVVWNKLYFHDVFLSPVLKKCCFYYLIFESVVSGGIFGSLFFVFVFFCVHLQRLFLHASAWWIMDSLCQDKVTFEGLGSRWGWWLEKAINELRSQQHHPRNLEIKKISVQNWH